MSKLFDQYCWCRNYVVFWFMSDTGSGWNLWRIFKNIAKTLGKYFSVQHFAGYMYKVVNILFSTAIYSQIHLTANFKYFVTFTLYMYMYKTYIFVPLIYICFIIVKYLCICDNTQSWGKLYKKCTRLKVQGWNVQGCMYCS